MILKVWPSMVLNILQKTVLCFLFHLSLITVSEVNWIEFIILTSHEVKEVQGLSFFWNYIARNWSRIRDPASCLKLWASKNGYMYNLFLFCVLLFVCFMQDPEYLQEFLEDFKIVVSTWAYKQIRAATVDRSVFFFSALTLLLSVLFPCQAWLSLLLGHSYLMRWWDLGCDGGDSPYFRQNLGKNGTTHSEFIKEKICWFMWLCQVLVVACRVSGHYTRSFHAELRPFVVVHGLLSACGSGTQ